MRARFGAWAAPGLAVGLAVLAGCRQDMHDNPRYEPLEASAFFADGRASRPQVAGTIARDELVTDRVLATGLRDGEPVAELPLELSRALLERGRERYQIYCMPCHDRTGYGEGMVVKRGMTRPPSLHIERLRGAPLGYFFDVITNGYGVMYDYSDRISVEDRWAIVAWVRTLQLSQHAELKDVPAAARLRLEEQP